MKAKQYNTPQEFRDLYIRALGNSKNATEIAVKNADDLFALDLTVYSKNYNFESLLYNAFATSVLDESISLHPEQLRIIKHIENNSASIISAPTSFGKTFCIFEYIARHTPNNIVLIVPTLALVDEYFKKIIKKYHYFFSKYKVFTTISETDVYNFSKYNIFILTHDRIVNESAYSKLEVIDFLVIDEVYKLETDIQNDRVLVLNMAYYFLAKIASKYTLLAPFISGVLNTDKLDKKPTFISSDFSPVVNDIIIREILNEKDRFSMCQKILKKDIKKEEKTLIYFPTVVNMYKYIKEIISEEDLIVNYPDEISYFIEWAKDEIHEEWCVITALQHGYVIHNGQIPIGTRMFQLNLYNTNDNFNRMLCTSTLLEGVNTSAKNIIITKPSRKSNKEGESFAAFDFFNLVGRTGRLYHHHIGNAYYIKSPLDPIYKKTDAIKEIKFEIVDSSKDIDIQKGNIETHQDVKVFLKKLNIDVKEYLEKIGSKLRFDTVFHLYENYEEHKNELIKELQAINKDDRRGRYHLISILYVICENDINKLDVNLLTSLINKSRPKVKTVVNNAKKYFTKIDINQLIASAIKIKNSYLEHQFYTKVSIIGYFMSKNFAPDTIINILNDKILQPIEILYFINSKHKKMLVDFGIYERDVDKILKIIGIKFNDSFEMKQLLTGNESNFNGISYLSKYVIQNLK